MIGVIADDLTGAAEIAGVGLRHGMRAEILISGRPGAEADLVCINTESRSCSPREAGRRAAAAAKLFQQSKAAWIFKKVDSVLRGQIAPEIEAVMNQLHLKRALLAPANPSRGRVIKNGRYFIHDKPLNKTEFARDPEYPRQSSVVVKLLTQPKLFSISMADWRSHLPDTGIVVAEVADASDLDRWTARDLTGMLLAGGAEFFTALLRAKGCEESASRRVETASARQSERAVGRSNGCSARVANGERVIRDARSGRAPRELFVCGTLSKAARAFLSSARASGTPVFSLPRELVWGAEFTAAASEIIGRKIVGAFENHSRVILTVGLRTVRERAVSMRLASHLAQLAGAVLRRVEVSRIYAEGGTTAAELAQEMGWGRLQVLEELAPGVATLAVDGGSPMRLTIKPGSYLWPDRVRIG
ncbi:MAG TPA: four-carbon acid sugar kinase family protein [Verrucomicrobiae bacterium]|nr:four-carbon acid sugar kinase family protein [Verrucomicrobiae bacterium]